MQVQDQGAEPEGDSWQDKLQELQLEAAQAQKKEVILLLIFYLEKEM